MFRSNHVVIDIFKVETDVLDMLERGDFQSPLPSPKQQPPVTKTTTTHHHYR